MNEDYTSLALNLARQAQGKTRPNPPVGAVLVKDARVVGRGFTQPAGQSHAEIVALQEAGERASGATLYTSLEPCSHWGRTPPCSEALVRAGIAAAHIALLDPNPRVRGQGVERLREAGVEVVVGQGSAGATELVEAHATYTTKGRPFVTVLDPTAPSDVGSHFKARNDVVVGVDSHGVSVQELFVKLRCEDATSCLVLDNPGLSNRLLEEHLVDKIVTSPTADIPSGFVSAKRVDQPSPHLLLYPAESAPYIADSDTSPHPAGRNA